MFCVRNRGRSNTNNTKPMKLMEKRELGREGVGGGERERLLSIQKCHTFGALVAEMRMELIFKTCFKYQSKFHECTKCIFMYPASGSLLGD